MLNHQIGKDGAIIALLAVHIAHQAHWVEGTKRELTADGTEPNRAYCKGSLLVSHGR
jgi:hypothetical protein